MFMQVLNWKLICSGKNSENTSGTDKHILDSVTRITRFFECFTVSCFARDTKSNRLICGVPCPAQTQLFLLKYFEEHIFDYHGLGNKKMLFLESRQETCLTVEPIYCTVRYKYMEKKINLLCGNWFKCGNIYDWIFPLGNISQLRRIPFPACILLVTSLTSDKDQQTRCKIKGSQKLVTQCLDKQAKYWIDTQFFNHNSFQNLKLDTNIFPKNVLMVWTDLLNKFLQKMLCKNW